MNKILSLSVGVIAVLSLILGGVALSHANRVPSVIVGSTGSQGPKGDRGPVGPQGVQGPRGITSATPTLGAVTGPDSYFPYVANNDVKHYSFRNGLNSASIGTTTPCSFQILATSTITFSSLLVTQATSSATTWTLSTSTSGFASTSRLGSADLGPGGIVPLIWRSGITQAQGAVIPANNLVSTTTGAIFPGTWVNWTVAGGTGAGANGVVVGGFCELETVQL